MPETSPLLILSLAIRRQQRGLQRQQQQQQHAGGDQQEQRQPQPQQQQRQQRQRQQRQQPPQQQSPLMWRRSSLPILPVIHEGDGLSSGASSAFTTSPGTPGSNHSRALRRIATAVARSGSFNSASSSSTNGTYENFNRMSHQIVWPPADDSSWPPRNQASYNEQGEGGSSSAANHNNYGSIDDQHYTRFIESEDYITSSPSSESSPECNRRNFQPSTRRHHGYLRSIVITGLALSLSAAVWLPLFQEQPMAGLDQDDYFSSADDDDDSPSPFEYFRQHLKNDDDDDDDLLNSSYQEYLFPNSSSYPTWRHRNINRRSKSIDGGNHSISFEDEGIGSQPTIGGIDWSIPANISFADLAAAMLPRYFQKAVDLCVSTIVPVEISAYAVNTALLDNANGGNITEGTNDTVITTSVMPDEVYQLRKQILKTRDLFDVFSPVYSKHSSLGDYTHEVGRKHVSWGEKKERFELTLQWDTHGKKMKNSNSNNVGQTVHNKSGYGKLYEMEDLWKTLRQYLDNGYTLIGDFQDLNHANIKYSLEQLTQYQRQVWQWNQEFMAFVEENRRHISFYLSIPCERNLLTPGHVPCRHAHSHSSHLFWGNATSHELPDGNLNEATSVLLQLGNSQLKRAEMYLNKGLAYEHVIPALVNATTDSEEECAHALYHNLRKELRSFLDEVDLFGHLLIPGSSILIPEIEKGMKQNTTDLAVSLTPGQKQIKQALKGLKRARTLLGDMNDDYVAYSMYLEWNEYPNEQLRLQELVEAQWDYFRSWTQEADLVAQLQFLQGLMLQEHSAEKYRSLESFLVERKERPTNHFVIGNDAGDADSIISAISLAYITSIHGGEQMTPVLPISKDTFTYGRPEINLLLQMAGIEEPSKKLLFIDDLKAKLEHDFKGVSPRQTMALVDHNTINKSLRHYRDHLIVTEIVDHHKDEQQYKEMCKGNRNIAFEDGHALVASTTTLMAERLREYPSPYPATLSLLLLGVILLDSVNLDTSVGKVTPRDQDAVDDLLLHTDWNEATPLPCLRKIDNGDITIDTDELFKKLQDAKYDPLLWDSFSVKRALNYDYKDFRHHGLCLEHVKRHGICNNNFGISSILMPGLDFMSKEGFYVSTLEFMTSKQIPFLGIMFAFYDEEEAFHRQLAFVSMDQTVSLNELVGDILMSAAYKSSDLQLAEIKLAAELSWRDNACLFDQNNLAPSRKRIGPMLESF